MYPAAKTAQPFLHASTNALKRTSEPDAFTDNSRPLPTKKTSPTLTGSSPLPQDTVAAPSVTIAMLGPSTTRCVSDCPASSAVMTTENSGIGGSYKRDGREKALGCTACFVPGPGTYVKPSTRLGISRSLGVSPARMTLSEYGPQLAYKLVVLLFIDISKCIPSLHEQLGLKFSD